MTDSPSQRLRKARIERGYETAADAARAHGWNLVTYASHENGSRGITRTAALKYAKAFHVPAARLLGLSTSGGPATVSTKGVPVLGTAAWGVWRDKRMLMDEEQSAEAYVPSDTSRIASSFGITVDDDSVNRAISRGAVAICEPLHGASIASLPEGALIAIRRSNGGLQELTIRRIAELGDKAARLSSFSSDARYKEILTVDHGDDSIDVIGRVVGVYTPLNV